MKKVILFFLIIGTIAGADAQETVTGINFQQEHETYNANGIHDSHLIQWNRLSLALKSENNSFRIEDWTLGANSIKTIFSANVNGNVGIGAGIPNYKLHVVGNPLGELANDKSILTTIEGKVSNYSKFQILNKRSSNGSSWLNTSLRLQRVVDVTEMAFIDFGIDNKNANYGLAFGTRNGFNGTQQTRMVIEENGNVGIGTTNADAKLRIEGSKSLARFKTEDDGFFEIQATRSSSESSNTSLKLSSQNHIILDPNPNGTTGNVGIGTTSPDMKLTVKGNIHAEEVKIDLSVPAPDYVFKENYTLRTIEEVEKFIKKNSHLPEIPSAKEFKQDGLMLAEMDMNLLKKIEELTLYTIQQQKEIESLKKENVELKSLANRLVKIEQLLESKN